MTPKFRIYDKDTASYIPQSSSRFLISSSGRLYDAIKFEWHEIGVRYVVEMATGEHDMNGVEIYQGDVGQLGKFLGTVEYEHGCFSLSGIAISFRIERLKIIGTIHDEKYKNL